MSENFFAISFVQYFVRFTFNLICFSFRNFQIDLNPGRNIMNTKINLYYGVILQFDVDIRFKATF